MKMYAQVKSRITACVLVVIVAAGTCVVPTMSRAENAASEKSVSVPRCGPQGPHSPSAMRSPIATQAHSSETLLMVVLCTRGASFLARSQA